MSKNDIKIEYDSLSSSHYIYWEAAFAVVGLGVTKIEALNDLQQAAHFLIDSLIDTKLKELANTAL